jgi:hypothetical protein
MPDAIGGHVAWQVVDGETVLVDLPAGRVLGLSPVASLIWSLVTDHDEAAIAAEVSRQFDVDFDTARRDVAEFTASLRQRGLLTRG